MTKPVSPADVLAFFATLNSDDAPESLRTAIEELSAVTYDAAAIEILSRKVNDESELDTAEFARQMFELAATVSENFTTALKGGQNGGRKVNRAEFGFDTPTGHIYVRVDS